MGGSRGTGRRVVGLGALAALAALVALAGTTLQLPPVSAARSLPAGAGLIGYTFEPSDLSGGGFQNVAAISPFATHVAALGGDDSGFHTTPAVDGPAGTVQWIAANGLVEPGGLSHDIDLRVASLRWSAATDTVYAVTGNYDWTVRRPGPAGQLLVGSYSPTTGLIAWAPDGTTHAVKVEANGLAHPRPTGNLIALNETASGVLVNLFVGESDGIFDYRPGPSATWQRVASPATLGGARASAVTITSLVRDPAVADTLYVTVTDSNARRKTSGLWMLTGCAQASGCGRPVRLLSGVFQAASVSSDLSRNLTVLTVGGRMPVGPSGVWQCLRTSGSFTCKQTLSTGKVGIASIDSVYNAQTASVDSYALLEGAVASGSPSQCKPFGGGDTVFVSTNDASTFTGATNPTAATVGTEVGANAWWFAAAPNRLEYLLGCVNFQAGQIAVDPNDPNTVLVASRAGAWRSTNALATTGIAWSPAVTGLGVSVDYAVSPDPTAGNAGQVAVGDADYKLFTDAGHLLLPGQPVQLQPYSVPNDTLASAFDSTQPSCIATPPSCPLFLGYGDIASSRDGGVGYYTGLFGSATPAPPVFTSIVGPGSLWPATKNRVVGLAPGMTSDLTRRVLAVLDSGGMYEFNFTAGTWSAVATSSVTDLTGVTAPPVASPGAEGVPTNFIDIWWPTPALGEASRRDVYVFDPASGLYHGESKAGDFSWTRVWALAAPSFKTANPHVGHLAGDPRDRDRLYVSYQDSAGYHLVMVDNARDGYVDAGGNDICTASPCFARTELTSALPAQTIPGPMVVDSAGNLYVATISHDSTPANLYESPAPSDGSTFTSVFGTQADADSYAGAQPAAAKLALSTDCYLYASAGGGGVSVIAPDTGSCG